MTGSSVPFTWKSLGGLSSAKSKPEASFAVAAEEDDEEEEEEGSSLFISHFEIVRRTAPDWRGEST